MAGPRRRAAEGRPVTVFGDGSQTRDFVYVEDVVRAFAAAGTSNEQGAINASTGVETSLLDLSGALELETVPGPARLGEIARSSLDPIYLTKLTKLGYESNSDGLRSECEASVRQARTPSTMLPCSLLSCSA